MRPSPPTERHSHRLSVVMPVLNEARDIGPLLEALLTQEPPPGGYEVLVADGGSTDATREIVGELAARHANVQLLDNPGRRSSAGRNVGARAARGDYILFIDGHCHLPRPDYLKRVVEIFQASGADCLCRPQPLDTLAGGTWARAIAAARHSWLGHNVGSDIYGGEPRFTDPRSAGAAYTRECFKQLGGYDERFDACEDVEFNVRVDQAAMRSFLHPDLAIPYRPRSTPGGLFRQMFRYGRGRARLMAKHPAEVSWVLTGLTLAAVLPLAVLIGVGWASALWLLGVGACVWLCVAAAESLRLGKDPAAAVRTMVAFGAIHLGLASGFWRGLAEAIGYRRPRIRTSSAESSR